MVITLSDNHHLHVAHSADVDTRGTVEAVLG